MQALSLCDRYYRDAQVPDTRRTGSWTWRRRLHDSRPMRRTLMAPHRFAALADLEDDHAHQGNARPYAS
jgi:hypothetical protein